MVLHVHSGHDNRRDKSVHLPDELSTLDCGEILAQSLAPGLIVYLKGDLGAGKTTLTRGILRGLGHAGKVKSPTYTLVEPYPDARIATYHFDFYRFSTPEEFLEAGLDEYFQGAGCCLVEWPDKAQPYLPPADMEISLYVSGAGRQLNIQAHSKEGEACANRFAAHQAD
ncbi:tRNA (adenosine(37)-N6)-threonylcarbamoyltransferase complex ATPase subunit type 1 TsaE [Zoogloea sp.]|uniref:tRNA (adenosine(37)-N6)-threonylcarbamoyltransferase complex ATPase subunit type 1 TsaE n=1 Tax=Zoogloea sp. TaxID=49181 RepID=UPI0035B13E40|nr:tRNA (adenosine(37)-N6)-threonylcarbamoyltransferase complex ATPase subunit type 1 TsaE [Rhodocyclales bacterium]